MLEKELQSIIFKRLKNRTFMQLINNIGIYKGWLKVHNYNCENFSLTSILRTRYAQSVVAIFNKLKNSEYEIIGGENPQNISLDSADKIYPDIVINDCESNFYIIELKVGKKTEREAVTELFAYIFELRNHLPHINNSEISLVIISETFGALLSHAALQLIGFYSINVMCLKFEATRHDIKLDIYDPIQKLTKNEMPLTNHAFCSLSLSLYQEKKDSKIANESIDTIFKIAENMILDKANRINSNGYLILYMNNNNSNDMNHGAKYYITIYLINPFSLLDLDLLFKRDTPLSNAILNLHSDLGSYHLQNHFFEISKDAESFLNKFYNVRWEGPITYKQKRQGADFHANPLKCNVWGDFGDYLKNIIYNSHSGYDILNGEIDHTNPSTLLDIISQLLDD